MASIFEQSEYGLLGFLMSIANVAHAVSSLGIGKTRIVYGSKKENIYSATYTVGLVSTSITSLIIYALTQNVGLAFLSWGLMMFLLKTSELNSKGEYRALAKHRILRSSLTVVLAIGLFQILGINGVILGFALATLPTFGGLYQYAKKKNFSIAILRPKVSFMTTSWLFKLNNMLFWWGDKLIIGTVFGLSFLGTYQLAAQYLMLLDTIPRALFQYLLPQESQGHQNKKIKILSVGIACFIVLISIMFVPYLIEFFFPDYSESIFPAQIMSIAIVPITIYSIFETQFFGKEKPRIAVIGTGLQTVFYFALLLILGAEYGLIGVAIAFLISTMIRVTYYIIIFRKHK